MLNTERLHARADELVAFGLDAAWASWMVGWLEKSEPRELVRINPRRLAGELQADLHYFLRLMVGAVKVGIFDLNWEHFCPSCSGRAETAKSLGDAHSRSYCKMCKMDFDNVIDQNVVITFSLNEALSDEPPPEGEMMVMLGPDDVRAVELFTLQAFRELFPDDVLPVDESLKVADITLMFTDIRGSTSLYERLGDSKAYHIVRDHFRVLTSAVVRNRGAVVKTIGDSVMASFSNPLDAFKAAVTAQGSIAVFNKEQKLHSEDIIVRVGLDRGPAITVNLNDRLDFFGSTVNRAARVETISTGNDLVISEAVQKDPEVQQYMVEHGLKLAIERLESRVKGIEEPVTAFRLTAPRMM